MKRDRHLIVIILFVGMIGLIPAVGNGQSPEERALKPVSIDLIVDRLVEQFKRVQDYTVQVRISVNMPRLRMPRKTVRLFFKQPDRVKLEADGFAIVPKTGLVVSPIDIFRALKDVSIMSADTLDDHTYWLVEGTIAPDSDSAQAWTYRHGGAQYANMRLWVDSQDWVITRAETYLDTVNLISMQAYYQGFDNGIFLPKQTDIRFHFGKELSRIVQERQSPFGEHPSELEREGETEFQGSIKLEFRRYRINRGLKDKIFEESTF